MSLARLLHKASELMHLASGMLQKEVLLVLAELFIYFRPGLHAFMICEPGMVRAKTEVLKIRGELHWLHKWRAIF